MSVPYYVLVPPHDEQRGWHLSFHSPGKRTVEVTQPTAVDAAMWLLGNWGDRSAS